MTLAFCLVLFLVVGSRFAKSFSPCPNFLPANATHYSQLGFAVEFRIRYANALDANYPNRI